MPPVAGVKLATAAAGTRYPGRADMLLPLHAEADLAMLLRENRVCENKSMIKLFSCISIVSAVTEILLSLVPFICGQSLHAQQLSEGVSRNDSFFAHPYTIPATIQCASWCPIFQNLSMSEDGQGRDDDPDSSGAVMPANVAEVSFFAYPTSGRAPLFVQFTIIG